MAARKKPKAPGKNIEDWQRKTERLTLRLKPEVMSLLEELAAEVGPGKHGSLDPKKHYAKTIEQALHALDRELTAEVEQNEAMDQSGEGDR